jgi:uncharacterized membrane protein
MNAGRNLGRRGRRCVQGLRLRELIVCATSVALMVFGCGTGPDTTVQNPPPTFTTIDAPGAGTQQLQGTDVAAINSGGEVVGMVQGADLSTQGFARSADGSFTSISLPSGSVLGNSLTLVTDVNDSGDLVGIYFDAVQPGNAAFVQTEDGAVTTFSVPSSSITEAYAINNAGSVAGDYTDASGEHGFLRTAGGMITTFDIPSAATVEAIEVRHIDSSGALAGTFIDSNIVAHGFFRAADGTITIIDDPKASMAGRDGTVVTGANDNGEIVGNYKTGSLGPSHSFLRSAAGTYSEFDPPNTQGPGSSAAGINDTGTIVGEYGDANLVRHGYLRRPNGSFVTLDDPDAAAVSGRGANPIVNLGTEPLGINDSGAVIGDYSDANGERHGFLWQ